jgi:hypothetical protein
MKKMYVALIPFKRTPLLNNVNAISISLFWKFGPYNFRSDDLSLSYRYSSNNYYIVFCMYIVIIFRVVHDAFYKFEKCLACYKLKDNTISLINKLKKKQPKTTINITN